MSYRWFCVCIAAGSAALFCLAVFSVSTVFSAVIGSGQPLELRGEKDAEVFLEAIGEHSDRVFVMLGDSLLFGRTLRDVHGSDWRSHTFGHHLQTCFNRTADDPPTVINLASNGMVPTDFLAMMQRLDARDDIQVDGYLINLNSRSVSADFNMDDANANGGEKVVGAPRAWVAFGLLRRAVFDEVPIDAYSALLARTVEQKQDRDDVAFTLLKVRQRYNTASFDPDASKQANSLLAMISDGRVWTIDTVENPDNIRQIARRSKLLELERGKDALLHQASAWQRYVSLRDNLTSEDFTDHVHLTSDAYRRYAELVCERVMATGL